MRNWPKTTPGGSFRGFPFEVQKEGLDGAGRHVAVHTYAKAETHDTEDTARKARRFRVAAYIVGDDADAQTAAFVEICSTKGVGTLILPMTPPQQVRCLECSYTTDMERQGYVSFDLLFVEERGNGGVLAAIPLGDRLAQSALNGLADAAADALAALPF